MNIAKKLFAAGSAAAMLLSAAPALAAAHAVGTNVSSSGTVWMIYQGTSGVCRRAYTSAGAFLSYGFNSWSQVVEANSDDLALPVCSEGFIPPQDGSVIFESNGAQKGTGYIVSGGQKFGFPTEAIFKGQGYSYATATWADMSWMTMGGVINSADAAHLPGTLVNNNGTVQLIGNSGLMGVPDLATFNSWGYSFAKVVPANANDKAKSQTGVMAARQAGQLSPTAAASVPSNGGAFSASVATDNPASATLVAGQAIGDLAHFTVTGNGAVTSLKLQRIGVSSDSTLSSVFLYDGNARLTDSATVSSTFITFNDASGLLNVSGSRTFSVRANIASGTSGQTVGVRVVAINGTDLASMPSGNLHTIASVSNFATVDFNTTTTPSTSTITGQADYTLWQNVLTVGNRYVWMKSFALRQVGSVNTTDLKNFRLFVDGTMVGSAVASLDAAGYVRFDFASPVKLESGSRTIKMLGDIVGGANRNFSFSLRQASDAMFVDSEVAQPVLATANGSSFSARTTGTQTIDTGTLTITKKTDSPSGNVVSSAAGATLAKFDVKAYGEKMKVESLTVTIVEDDSDTAFTLRNGALFFNGVQVGSTAAIAGASDSTATSTQFDFGSSFIVDPATPGVLEVRGDIYDNDGSNGIAANDTVQVRINAGSSNVQRLTSLGYGSYPASAVSGNTLTVANGSLTVGKNTAYASHTIVAPKYAYKVGSYTITANANEPATITGVTVDFDNSTADAFDGSDDINNMYIVVGTYTSPVKSTITDSANSFSTNVAIAPGQTLTLDVYADAGSSATDGDGTADTGATSVTVAYTTTQSSTSTSATEVTGQTITFGAGAFAIAADGGSPLNRIVSGNQTGVEAGRFRFTATSDDYYIDEVNVSVSTSTVASVVSSIDLYDGATKLGTVTFNTDDGDSGTNNAGVFYFNSNPIKVSANNYKVLTVKYNLNTIGTGAGTSQSNAAVQVDRVKYHDSTGSVTTSTTDYSGNEMYVYKSVPTVDAVDLSNTTPVINGSAQDLYKFKVTASAQGDVILKQFRLTTSWSDGGTADTMYVESLKLFEDGVDVTSNVTLQDGSGNSAESTGSVLNESDSLLVVSYDTTKESVVPAGTSKTYTVRGVPQGFRLTGSDTAGDSVSFYIATDSAHNSTKVYLNGTATATTYWGLHTSAAATGSGTAYNFIWSDNSANPHAAAENASSSADWANGYKVLNLDLPGETWTK